MTSRYLPLLLGVLALAACRDEPSEGLRGTGTIEVTEIDISSIVAARVIRVHVQEGAAVSSGDTLASLSQTSLNADIEQRRARVSVAEAELRDLQAGARPSEVQRAVAELRTTEAEAVRTERDARRFVELGRSGSISQSQVDAAVTAAQVAASRRDAAANAMRLVREGARPERITAARAAVESARAMVAMAEATAADLILLAPISGIVLRRHAEPGEVIAAATPVVSLGDPEHLWVRVFVSPALAARLRTGGRTTVTLDGLRDRRFEGRVASIAISAEFTPRVALTESERADLLFGVRVELTDTTGTLKGGLPATVTFEPADTVARGGPSR